MKKTIEETFNRICSELDLTKETGLVKVESDAKDEFQKYILKQAKEKLGISDGIFFLNQGTKSSIPLIYFHRLESHDPAEIAKLHKLAWNMGQVPLLFIVLPESVLIYSGNKPPKKLDSGELDDTAGLIEELKLFVSAKREIMKIRKYHISEFITGRYWQKHGEKFKKENRVYQTLLKNLEFMREKLIEKGLPPEIVHILLSRAIFIKYLEDRKDKNNHNVFPTDFFEGYLTGAKCFTDLLSNKEATYNLFQFLSENKFNGNIFLLEKDEKSKVTPGALNLLHDLLKGEKYLDSGQMMLWPLYSFDVIPIELISNIYQKFFHHETERKKQRKKKRETKGTYFTPLHIVNFLMDDVLHWDGKNTNIKILDPSCGSGIFLVESYRRLISHWMQANPGKDPLIDDLTKILKENIFGVDINKTAIRIAALSLYLTICDYLEPRYIWEKVKFEPLINENLFESDFFEKDKAFSNKKYDLIFGNPPWQSELSEPAVAYIKESGKPIGNKQICQAFLWRVADLCEPDGEICMLVSSKALLFNRSKQNQKFRREFLSTFNVKTVINFSAFRKNLFSDAVGPGAAVIFSTDRTNNNPIFYCSPKPSYSPQDDWLLLIEPQDINYIPREEAIENDIIWKVAMWGTPRDYELIKRLTRFISIKKICGKKGWECGKGFILGGYLFSLGLDYKQNLINGPVNNTLRTAFNKDLQLSNEASITQEYKRYWKIKDREKVYTIEEDDTELNIYIGDYTPSLSEKPYVDADELQRFAMNEDALEPLGKTYFNRYLKTKPEVFQGPHLLINKSPKVNKEEPERDIRLVAALLKNDAVFTQAIFGIHGKESDLNLLVKCCLILNTKITLYYQMLISSNWLIERDILTNNEILDTPMPKTFSMRDLNHEFLKERSEDPNADEAVNKIVADWYDLDESEIILVNDAIDFTLDAFRRKNESVAFEEVDKNTLENYVNTFCSVLNNSFSSPKKVFVGTTVYLGKCPLKAVSVKLMDRSQKTEEINFVENNELEEVFKELDQALLEERSPSVYIRRHLRRYSGNTIFIVKPNQMRYWTKSSALCDADKTYADIMSSWRDIKK